MSVEEKELTTLGRFINVSPKFVSLVSRPSSGSPFETIVRAYADDGSQSEMVERSGKPSVIVYRFETCADSD